VFLNGYHGDCSEMFTVGEVDEAGKKLIQVTYKARAPPRVRAFPLWFSPHNWCATWACLRGSAMNQWMDW
jgi:hypothetical protein